MVSNEGKVQAKTKMPSLNKRLKLLGISKTAYYYKPIMPFSLNNDKKLLNAIDDIYIDYSYSNGGYHFLASRTGFVLAFDEIASGILRDRFSDQL